MISNRNVIYEQSAQMNLLRNGTRMSRVYSYRRFGIGGVVNNNNNNLNNSKKEKLKDNRPKNPFNLFSKLSLNSSAVTLYSTLRITQCRIFELGLSFLALILLTGKLYEVDREVSFLKFISNEWIDNNIQNDVNNSVNSVRTSNQRSNQIQIFHIENFKQDIEILIVELWSARTTLILSLVFVLVYIISWGWMAYAVSETHSSRDVSLKTVLLLAVFAAVDIAASAGFVMVRVIMYAMRDHYFPKDMRIPLAPAEHDQMVGFAALRLATLKSSSGATDVFVSVIVGFLTGLRVYSVICAVSYYRKVRKDSIGSSDYSSDKTQVKDIDDFLKQSPTYAPKVRALNAHKERERRFSITGISDTIDEERTTELKIQAADMPVHMQKAAVQSTTHAIKVYTTEKHIAESVKQDFDQLYGPTWHCIVGRNWGSCVTHSKACYIRMLFKDLTILLYKST